MVFQQVVLPALVQDILHFLNSDHTSTHLRVTKALDRVRTRSNGPGLKRDVEVFAASCFVYQKRNKETYPESTSMATQFSNLHGQYWFLRPTSAFHRESIHPFDRWPFTKWHEAVLPTDQSAPTTTKALEDHWITRFGCPESLHSDQGSDFETTLFTNPSKLIKLGETLTAAFQPQSNAVIERTKRTPLNMLAKTTDKYQRKWSELFPYVKLVYRTSVHESTGYMPYFLRFGHERTLPIDQNFPRSVTIPGQTITSLSWHGSGLIQPTNRLFSTCKVNRNVSMHFKTL